MKTLLSAISLILLLSSCTKDTCEDKYYYLTNDEISWLSYSGGEVLIFKSNDGLYDTSKVSNRILNYEGKHIFESKCSELYQNGLINIPLADSGFSIVVKHIDNSASIILPIPHTNSYFQFAKFSDFSPQNNISINGTTYNNVYVMNLDTTNFLQPTVWRIFYTKQNGILKFDITKGQNWTRVN